MTREQVMTVLEVYERNLRRYADPKRADEGSLRSPLEPGWTGHVLYMIEQARGIQDMEKLMRWLGFIQGVQWALGMYSIAELKTHNRTSAADEDP